MKLYTIIHINDTQLGKCKDSVASVIIALKIYTCSFGQMNSRFAIKFDIHESESF